MLKGTQSERRAARGIARTGPPRSSGRFKRQGRLAVGVILATIGAVACVPDTTQPTGNTAVTVKAPTATIAYGTTPSLTPTYQGLPGGATQPTTPATCTTTATASSPVGTYPTTCSGAAQSGATFTYVAGQITITRAALLITASSETMPFGGDVPTISAGYQGLAPGDSGPATLPVCTTDATSTSPAGTYTSTCSGAADPNYDITYADGVVTVAAADVVVTASSSSSVYGDAVAAVTATYSGLAPGESAPATPATCTTTADASSPAGDYATTCSGADDPNHTFTYVDGVATITPAAATVIASSHSVSFGDPIPAITATYSGLVNGDSAPATAPTCSTTATAGSLPGDYPTTCAGAADPNYVLTPVDGTLTIVSGTAPVVVTASSDTVTYGDAIPAITPSYSGFGGGQTDPATAPTCTTTATSSSPVGSYPTTCSGAADPGYSFGYVEGTITIQPATVTVTASSDTMAYGDAAPAITPSYDGFLFGETGPLTAPTCTTDASSSSSAGTYGSTCSGADDPNYTFTYVDGTVEVTPVAATITASSDSATYGTAATVTASYSGLVNGDTAAATAPTCASTATASSPVGSYTATCSGADDPNYTFTYVDGTTTVTPAAATVTAPSSSVAYGSSIPTLDPVYGGLVNGDVAPATAATCSTTAGSGDPVGSYPTSCSGADDPNYTFTYADGSLSVTPVAVTVTPAAASMTEGATPPSIDATYSGLVNGDTAPATPATCTSPETSYTPAGTYPSSKCAGAADPNYTFTYAPGTLTVAPSGLVVGYAEYNESIHTTTITAASDAKVLPQATVNVVATTSVGFVAAGYNSLTVQTNLGPRVIFCKSIAATSFGGCQLGSGTMSTGFFVSDAAPNVFDVYTIIPGGKTAVQPSSLTIVTDVPAAQRGMPSTVVATAANGLVSYVQSAAPTGTFSLTFGYCDTGTATYDAADPTCHTGDLVYSKGVTSNLGADVTASIITNHVYQKVTTAVRGPSTVPAGSTFIAYSAPGASAIPKLQSSSLGDATVNTSSKFTAVVPLPAGMTYVGAKLIGGDALTSGVATLTYCPTTTSPGCTAKTTGNYTATTAPYLLVTLPTGSVPGGGSITMPTIAMTLKATGTTGTVANFTLTEFITALNVTAPIVGSLNTTFDGYPTAGNNTNVTPPKAPPVTLATVTIS